MQVVSRQGPKLTVSVGPATVQLTDADVTFYDPSADAAGPGSRSRKANQRWRPGSAPGTAAGAAARRLRASAESGGEAVKQITVSIQTEYNTVDVRGCDSDEAPALVDEAVSAAPQGAAVFVIHGLGSTGRLRAAIHAGLRDHPDVARFELEKASAGGCTVVFKR